MRVSLLPRLFEVVGSSVEFDDLDGLTMLGVRRFGLTRSSRSLKRAFDLVGSTLGLIAARARSSPPSRSRSGSTRAAPSSSARPASAATASPSRSSSSARCASTPRQRKADLRAPQRDERPVQDRRRPAHHARRALPAQDLARRAAAADQRAARRDEPRRPAPAGGRRGRAGRRLRPRAGCTSRRA